MKWALANNGLSLEPAADSGVYSRNLPQNFPFEISSRNAFAPLLKNRMHLLPEKYRFDLQRFSAEDEGRTEDPTDRRKREEREKGNVPKSQDIPQTAVLLGGILILFFMATWLFARTYTVFKRYLGMDFRSFQMVGIEDGRGVILDLFREASILIGPLAIGVMLLGIIGNVVQVGFLFTLRPLEFRLERLIPDMKRVLPTRRTMIQMLKIVVQFTVISIAAYIVILGDFIPMLKSGNMELRQALALFAWIAFKLVIITGIVLLVLAIPDYFYQRFEYMENLKMTLSEVKRERKEEEGDPMIRQRQRERAMELRRQRNMLRDVPESHVVITNPTHYAVALKYEPGESQAPMVVAKGADHMAFLIRSIARQNNVPVEENPPLARLLYKEVDVGTEIPDTMYRAVSLIFARLDRFRRMRSGV